MSSWSRGTWNRRLWPAILFTVLYQPGYASESVDYLFGPEISANQGCERAVARMKRQAIERQCGTEMAAALSRHKTTTIDQLDLLHYETLYGVVTDIGGLTTRLSHLPDQPRIQTCQVEATVNVRCFQGQRDPAFVPDFHTHAKLNESVYREGDEVSLTLSVTSPVYLNVLQYLPSAEKPSRLTRLYPNRWQNTNPIPANIKWQIPQGYRLQATLPEQQTQSQEYLLLVATRHPLDLPDTLTDEAFFSILSRIPLQHRREALIPYLISASGPSSTQPLNQSTLKHFDSKPDDAGAAR